jgi:hypothetical protein
MARRRFGRVRAFAGLAGALCTIPFWLMARPRSQSARAHERAVFARIAKSFGVSIKTHGPMSPEPGTLFIMNHISRSIRYSSPAQSAIAAIIRPMPSGSG